MISIIIIGHNEGWRLTLCLKSILVIINKFRNFDFEVIYVDSNSTDDSIERTKIIQNVKVFKLEDNMNAAIARNVGAKESKGSVLYFVDGDMELNPDFLSFALNEKGELLYDLLTGHLDDFFYNYNHKFLENCPRTYTSEIPKEIQLLRTNGGIFIIKRDIWNLVLGMNNKFKINEDIDLSIRLSNKKIFTKRLPYLIAKHHTIDYRNEKRMWRNLWAGFGLYPGLILRKHFFNIDVIKNVLRSQYTAIFLMLIILINIFKINIISSTSLIYLIALVLRVIFNSRNMKAESIRVLYFIKGIINQFFLDVSFWVGFFMFYPMNKIEIYTKV